VGIGAIQAAVGIPSHTELNPAAAREAKSFDKTLRASMGQEVSRVVTPLSGSEAARALSHAWRQRFGHAPTKEQLSVLVAQWGLETGSGRSMVGYNFGGIKGTGPSGLTVACKTTEGYGDKTQHIVYHFRAYRNADEGAKDYVNFLAKHYGGAMDRAVAGDAAGFVRALKRGGYFTGSEEVYVRSVTSLAEKVRTEGFDSIGSGGSHMPVHVAAQVQSPTAPMPTYAPAGHEAAFADAYAFADEIARAATRIAATNPEDNDNAPKQHNRI
jgi:hypothetical protein